MKKRILAIIISVILIGSLVGLGIINKNKQKFVSIKASKAVKGDVNSYLSTTAVIKAKDSKQYYGIQAKVKSVNVKLGDKIKKGDVLVSYDVQNLNSNVKQAQLQYDNAVLKKQELIDSNNDTNQKINDLNNQIADYDNQINSLQGSKDQSKVTTLQQQKSTVEQQKNNLKLISSTQFSEADNSIALAKVNLDQANENLSKNTSDIVADMDGVVTQLNVSVGAMGNPAQAAIEVQNLDNMQAKVSAGKYDILKLKVGETATIKNGDKSYNGTVSSIEPVAVNTVSTSGQDTTLPVYIDITDKAPDLKANFNVDIDILVGQAKDVIKVPIESVKTEKDGSNFVFTVQGDKAVKKSVKLGLQSDIDVEIKEGITADEKVILNPGAIINDGTFVKDAALAKKGGISNAGGK